MLGDRFILLGTGSSSEMFAVSEATLLMTCSGNMVLEQDMVIILPRNWFGRVDLAGPEKDTLVTTLVDLFRKRVCQIHEK